MGEIHQLILQHGKDRAREMVPREQKALVDAAASVLADESRAMGITYSGFCLTALPHKRLSDDQTWRRDGHKVTLVVQPGVLLVGGKEKMFGVPYGSRARLILLYLQTRALQSNSREVELGASMRDWMSRMNVSTGGQSYRDVKEQCNRLSACHLTFFWDDADSKGRGSKFAKDSIVVGGLTFTEEDERQGSLWEERVLLSESFFKSLREHPVPVLESAIRQISSKSMAMDIYIWLAYRLHCLTEPTKISWQSLYAQFGAGYDEIRHFKTRFPETLKVAMNVYPEAKVEIGREGMTMHPSVPPIANDRRQAMLMGM
ncbi:hypothetical protein M2352_003078 [Azospirillum fermentarium]|uniref:replication protein RepA n=1 Tax=Azospirillum fermentarium TaxID=1233114 RepID=UPI0022278DF4|nr:replication protein RepA [Azospirillum fermentarium]MCW2247444.1 hypothetical protein [Azospirillum fermentarium]